MHAALIALFLGNLALAGGPKFDAASQNLVGTYATVDGSYRIVLDRFSQPPRMQVAGSKDVVQLTLIERTGGRIASRNRTPPATGAVVQAVWPLRALLPRSLD